MDGHESKAVDSATFSFHDADAADHTGVELDAQMQFGIFERHYNEDWPHSSLGNIAPQAYANNLRKGSIPQIL